MARRLQQEEASKSKQSGAPIVLPSAMTPETMSAIQYAMREETKATKPVSLDSGMTPETMRAIHEIVNADRVRKSAVEAQDAELARWLQRRESEPNFSGQRLGMCREQVENEQVNWINDCIHTSVMGGRGGITPPPEMAKNE